ncbi:hypothetical protein F5B22DRAFT_90214 [Xylaria bambusicola]|uniref:uncharacterized protein n=1 Tax=Xylaria bambusicola TaxID=326684 RepID=UPI0020084712|nr:uncharacterized protein F5B22DRAFT_90214 [Xylaria bambusicola]KAI0518072.1 hypothetical protein F5B22DRAFT_90214 [Xylaria bambusicola]
MSGPTQTLQCHHIIRVASIATSIVAARHLFANGFHYPLLMLLAHVSIAVVIEAFGIRSETITTQKPPHSWTIRAWQALFAVLVAVGLIFTYHSFLHNRNTTLGVMLLGLDWTTILCRTVRWLRQDKQHPVDFPLSIVTFSLCIALLLWRENWLVGKGIEFLLIAVICLAVARHLWLRGLVENPVSFRTVAVDAYAAALGACLLLATFLLAVTGWYNRRDFGMKGRLIWMVLSAVSGSLALFSETSLKKLSSRLQERMSIPSRMDLAIGSSALPLLVLAAVEVDNLLTQHRPSTTSGVQWLGFAIAYLSTVDITVIASSTVWAKGALYTPVRIHDEQVEEAKSPVPEDTEALYPPDSTCANNSPWLRHISLAWNASLGSLALLLAFYCAIGAAYTEPSKRSWDLDIVIARYDEPVEQVVETVQLALQLPNIAGRKVRTIVYNKGVLNETELRTDFPIQSGLVIRQLENVGREGDTYLSHVLDSEQDWASHTLFIQAEPHEPGYLQARLEDYFVEDTGFLSLSHVRNFCASCDACNDHSGWSEDGAVLRDIFERANSHKTCQDISLTYRGQFVVSSRRMKQANQELLRDVRRRLLENERFGFTLERSWGTLFQCPTISERCPTLLSGWIGNRAAVEDCQCLDSGKKAL